MTKTLVATPDPTCGHTVRTPSGITFVCVREPHDWGDSPVADHRRGLGKVINPDRHVMVRRADS